MFIIPAIATYGLISSYQLRDPASDPLLNFGNPFFHYVTQVKTEDNALVYQLKKMIWDAPITDFIIKKGEEEKHSFDEYPVYYSVPPVVYNQIRDFNKLLIARRRVPNSFGNRILLDLTGDDGSETPEHRRERAMLIAKTIRREVALAIFQGEVKAPDRLYPSPYATYKGTVYRNRVAIGDVGYMSEPGIVEQSKFDPSGDEPDDFVKYWPRYCLGEWDEKEANLHTTIIDTLYRNRIALSGGSTFPNFRIIRDMPHPLTRPTKEQVEAAIKQSNIDKGTYVKDYLKENADNFIKRHNNEEREKQTGLQQFLEDLARGGPGKPLAETASDFKTPIIITAISIGVLIAGSEVASIYSSYKK